jgi:PAS domain S-box-containing protein
VQDASSLAESILEQIADAVIYADDTGTIRRWNHAATALFGYSAAEALGQNLDMIIPEHLRAAHWRGFEAAMTNGVMKLQGRPTVTRTTHQTGRKLYVEMTFALVKGQTGDAARGAVAVARDVTARIEQERAAAHRDSVGRDGSSSHLPSVACEIAKVSVDPGATSPGTMPQTTYKINTQEVLP